MNDNNINKDSEGMDYLVKHIADQETKDRWKKEFSNPIQTGNSKRRSRLKLISLMTAVAASLVLGILAFNSFGSNESLDSMATQQIASTMVELDEVTRGESDLLPESFTDAYNAGDYFNASASLVSRSLDSSREKFFYAVALSKSGKQNNRDVISLLNDVVAKRDIYYTEALWFRALAELKNGHMELARKDLIELKKRGYKKENVADLLNRI